MLETGMLTFTTRAREMVQTFMAQSDDSNSALRILLTGGSPVAPTFELTLVDLEDREAGDLEVDGGGFTVLVDASSAPRLEGARVDFVEGVNEAGFEITPRAQSQAARKPTGAIAEKVQDVLDHQVNPSVASHGGQILLVGVEGTEIYMEMTGGCKGCAMSRMTLRQGVEKMIRQAVPEITAIHDVTDHESGENPYFTA